MEVIVLLIAGAWLASKLHKEEPKEEEEKKKEDPPPKPEVKAFQAERIIRKKTPEGEEEYIREVTPVVHNYPVAWTESYNHRK